MSRRFILTPLFFGFLYPFALGGNGVNYGFLLLPLGVAVLRGRLRFPGKALVLTMAVYVLVYFAASLYQLGLIEESGRRLVSFMIFMSIFSFAFVEVDAEMIVAFKRAVVAISVYFSILSVYVLLSVGAVNLGFGAKDLVGSQRFGFIYVVAFWLTYTDPQLRKSLGVARHAVLPILGAGLLLTFSRASIVAILSSFGLYSLSRCGAWLVRLSVRGVLQGVASIAGLALLIVILYQVFPVPFDFFGERLFGLVSNADAVQEHLLDQNSSEGTRVVLAQRTLEYVSRNPITGAGYLGVWIMPDAPEGSAHNQYLDVLFRTGLLGFSAYLYLLLAALVTLFRREQALFWGLVGVLVYGLFHETFKESQGACLLAFLIGMVAQTFRHGRARLRDEAHAPPVRTTRASAVSDAAGSDVVQSTATPYGSSGRFQAE
jgi:hypothetical protein